MRNHIVLVVVGLMMWGAGAAKADHSSPSGSVGRLVYEAQELGQVVRYVGLNFQVLQAVDRFNYDVARLADCVRATGGGRGVGGPFPMGSPLDDHLENPGVSYQCRGQLDMARRSFYPVERYLRDTNYDLPQVYRQFLETRESLLTIQVGGMSGPGYPPYPSPGPGPGAAQISCVAVDSGWEEHGRGHVGYGFNLIQAQRMAMMECQRFHGRCRIQQCR